MIKIELHNIGKRFGANWIFRSLNDTFNAGDKIAITGKNGSGKSTLLQIIAGYIRPTEGRVALSHNGKTISAEHYYQKLSWAAPYIDLVEDLTAKEFIRFYSEHKTLLNGFQEKEVLELCNLIKEGHLPLKAYSSGMKQRIKLVCAFLADTPLILLDEPLSNVDDDGVRLYQKLIAEFTSGRTMIICSNDTEQEIYCCSRKLSITDYLI